MKETETPVLYREPGSTSAKRGMPIARTWGELDVLASSTFLFSTRSVPPTVFNPFWPVAGGEATRKCTEAAGATLTEWYARINCLLRI